MTITGALDCSVGHRGSQTQSLARGLSLTYYDWSGERGRAPPRARSTTPAAPESPIVTINTEEDRMPQIQAGAVNVVDHHPQNPWGSSELWYHSGAVAVGQCRGFVEANPKATDDALWIQAKTIAGEVFDIHLDTGDPVSDEGLLAAIDSAMVPMLYAYMRELREHRRHKSSWLSSASSSHGFGLEPSRQ
jgi:hypothetical protein